MQKKPTACLTIRQYGIFMWGSLECPDGRRSQVMFFCPSEIRALRQTKEKGGKINFPLVCNIVRRIHRSATQLFPSHESPDFCGMDISIDLSRTDLAQSRRAKKQLALN